VRHRPDGLFRSPVPWPPGRTVQAGEQSVAFPQKRIGQASIPQGAVATLQAPIEPASNRPRAAATPGSRFGSHGGSLGNLRGSSICGLRNHPRLWAVQPPSLQRLTSRVDTMGIRTDRQFWSLRSRCAAHRNVVYGKNRANRKSRDSKRVSKEWKGDVLAVAQQSGRFLSIHPRESMGYRGRYGCPLDSRAESIFVQ
jgi:hypothetical protein